MSKPLENETRLYKHIFSSTASLPATSHSSRQRLPRPKPPDENVPKRARLSPSLDSSFESSPRGSPLYMRSSTHPPPAFVKYSPRTRDRRSRQSLSLIHNHSSPSLEDNDVAQKVSQSLAKEKMAWKVINREIAEWQNVCHTGRPSWWSPTSRWTRKVRSQSSINRDMSAPVTNEWVDEEEDLYYPGLCFEYERRKDAASDVQPWLHELAFLIAVQLLSACFTLPVEMFATYTTGVNITYDVYGIPEMPDERLISSLRMHTNYRWSPAFGHQARNTSPENQRSTSYGGYYTPARTPAMQSSPDVGDSGWRTKKKKQQHRARHVTPAETSQQEYWEDTYEQTYDFRSHSRTPTLSSWRDSSWRDRRDMAKSASYIPVPGRVIQSAPPTPLPPYKAVSLSRHAAEARRDEYPFPIQAAIERSTESRRYSLHPHLRSEPHHVFVQPVRELVVRRWRTFRRRFGYSLSHGNPDNINTATNANFTEEYTASTWSPSSPSLHPPPHSVRRRRDARSRHDIHSSSIDSSPRYNTPTSGTLSGMASGMTSPGLTCAVPQSTPMAGEVDDLIATARAITNSSSAIPQEPLTASQPFPVFTPNNTPDHTDDDGPSSRLPRNDAGYFTASRDSSTGSGPTFVPKANSSGKRQSRTHGSRRSRLSEVFTQEEVATEGAKYHLIQAAKRRLFDTEVHSTLTTPTEEGESDGSKASMSRRDTVVVMGDPPPTSILSPNLSLIVRLDSPSGLSSDRGVPRSEVPSILSLVLSPTLSTALSPSVASVDMDPFSFLSPRREHRDEPTGPGSPTLSPSPNLRPERPRRPTLGSMSRNESPIMQTRDSPSRISRSRGQSLGSIPSISQPDSGTTTTGPSMSYIDRWAAGTETPPSFPSMSDNTSRPRSYMDTYRDSPPGLKGAETLRQSTSSRPRDNLMPSSMSRDDSRSSTASSPAQTRLNPSLPYYPQPALPSLVRGDSRSSAASNRVDLARATTSFPHPRGSRPVLTHAALSWTNTPNNSEEERRGSWQSHKTLSSNDDAYDPHAVDCHSNLPSARGSDADLEARPGKIKTVKTEPIARREASQERRREVVAAEASRSLSVGARPSTIRRSVSTPVVRRQEPEYEEELRVGLGRNRLSRVSSSGTTHFNSGPEGIEVDGLPVGPDKEAWDVVPELWDKKVSEGLKRLGSSRRKKARSFL